MMTFPIYGKLKLMFQTTNQSYVIPSCSIRASQCMDDDFSHVFRIFPKLFRQIFRSQWGDPKFDGIPTIVPDPQLKLRLWNPPWWVFFLTCETPAFFTSPWGLREHFPAKPHDLHRKINGFRLGFSQQNQSIDYCLTHINHHFFPVEVQYLHFRILEFPLNNPQNKSIPNDYCLILQISICEFPQMGG